MEILSKGTLKRISMEAPVVITQPDQMRLPEKVIQFGTGVLLRGLPDYLIDKANKQKIFNGRILVVKSTGNGDTSKFTNQDNLYTVCIRGIQNGSEIKENVICSAISRVLFAQKEWSLVLDAAKNPEIKIVLSNTTEMGIELKEENILALPPVSFPAKLLAFLYARYQAFQGTADAGMVIIPTELITDNGNKLKEIMLELVKYNKLGEEFYFWVDNHNFFCNSLVDRIVPGEPEPALSEKLDAELLYKDALKIIAEPYLLWAIEGDENIGSILSFYKTDDRVKIASSIDEYRELKLRLLNGAHTLSVGLALLAGFGTVKDAMQNSDFSLFIGKLFDEIIMSLPNTIDKEKARIFSDEVLDRFRNPFVEHKWSSIASQYTTKMKTRCLPTLIRYYSRYNNPPSAITLGFAAFLVYTKVTKAEGNNYWGEFNGKPYEIKDHQAGYFYDKWKGAVNEKMIQEILNDMNVWEQDLDSLPAFRSKILVFIDEINKRGVQNTLKDFHRYEIQLPIAK